MQTIFNNYSLPFFVYILADGTTAVVWIIIRTRSQKSFLNTGVFLSLLYYTPKSDKAIHMSDHPNPFIFMQISFESIHWVLLNLSIWLWRQYKFKFDLITLKTVRLARKWICSTLAHFKNAARTFRLQKSFA